MESQLVLGASQSFLDCNRLKRKRGSSEIKMDYS